MYQTPINTKMKLRVGATFTLNQQMNAWRDEYWVGFRMINGAMNQDTAYHSAAVKGKIKLPVV